MPQRTTVFVSYSRRDKRWLDRLRVHLTPYDRMGALDLWDDSRIDPGDDWRAEIDAAIARSAASILLISPDFLASDFVVTQELPKLLHNAERKGARILPIVIEPCELSVHRRLASFQALNSPEKPLARMPRADAEGVLVKAAKVVGKLLAPAAPAGAERTASRDVTPADASDVFEELHSATVALAVLCLLDKANASLTLTDIEKALQLRSRKRAFAALNRFESVGWVEKSRSGERMRYQMTVEGARQLQRLVDASDGPVRRLCVPV